MDKIILFKDKKDCCGCTACMNICPKEAITMEEDEYGFLYPQINEEKCIKCGACKKICGYQKEEEFKTPLNTLAAAAKEEDILIKSASGGIFSTLAKNIISNGGVAYGCSMEIIDDVLSPMHIRVDNEAGLKKLQGSKYVQSYMGDTFKRVKEDLKNGKKVLLSGTPCQVAGLNSFLGNTNNDNLITADIICHGTPSAKFFQDYLSFFECKLKGKMKEFTFRDKTKGWGLNARVTYIDGNGKQKIKIIEHHLSSYYTLFLNSDIYRKNCYTCKYAGSSRVGDLTLGDYWGIERIHPEYLTNNGGEIDTQKGISCIIVNSNKGENILKELNSDFILKESTFENAAKQNGQLKQPSKESINRDFILNKYKTEGYAAIDKWYAKKIRYKKFIYIAWSKTPYSFKKLLKKIKG